MVEWLSLVVGAVDELVVDVGIGIVSAGISLVADITERFVGKRRQYSACVFVYMLVKTTESSVQTGAHQSDFRFGLFDDHVLQAKGPFNSKH